MVMAKPIEFWKASALPTISGGQARAERAEKCGESATTEAPQSSSKAILAQAGQSPINGKQGAAEGRNSQCRCRHPGAANALAPPAAEQAAEGADADDGEGQTGKITTSLFGQSAQDGPVLASGSRRRTTPTGGQNSPAQRRGIRAPRRRRTPDRDAAVVRRGGASDGGRHRAMKSLRLRPAPARTK